MFTNSYLVVVQQRNWKVHESALEVAGTLRMERKCRQHDIR